MDLKLLKPWRTGLLAVLLIGLNDPVHLPSARAAESSPQLGSRILGRVVNEAGEPIAGALVRYRSESATTDEAGEFSLERGLISGLPMVQIEATGFAPSRLQLQADGEMEVIRLNVGANLRGRLLNSGRPVVGAKLLLETSDERGLRFLKLLNALTDAEGRFEFNHVPPRTRWTLFGDVESLGSLGALLPRSGYSSGNGITDNLGDLPLQSGLVLSGRVVVRDGGELPGAPILIVVSEPLGRRLCTVTTDRLGAFSIQGLPPGPVRIGAGLPEYHLTPWNRSFDPVNRGLIGRLDHSVTNLVIEISRKRYRDDFMGNSRSLPVADHPENHPIGGVEPGARTISVSGSVVDEATGRPVAPVEIVPGLQPPIAAKPAPPWHQRLLNVFRDPAIPLHELPFWRTGRSETVTNGQFSVLLDSPSSLPLLLVKATGYEPVVVGPVTTSTNGLVVRLTRGSGPAGLVLDPAGQPAVGARVIHAVQGETFGMRETGELMPWGAVEGLGWTDPQGAFALPSRLNGRHLYVSHATGWAMLDDPELGAGLKLRLQSWSVVAGVLVNQQGMPVANEALTLDFQLSPSVNLRDPLILKHHAFTAADGRFTLTNVPPGELRLMRGAVLQLRFHARAGETNDLGQVIFDTPPPEPLLRQLKEKIGL